MKCTTHARTQLFNKVAARNAMLGLLLLGVKKGPTAHDALAYFPGSTRGHHTPIWPAGDGVAIEYHQWKQNPAGDDPDSDAYAVDPTVSLFAHNVTLECASVLYSLHDNARYTLTADLPIVTRFVDAEDIVPFDFAQKPPLHRPE
jgi:hypothetical protein